MGPVAEVIKPILSVFSAEDSWAKELERINTEKSNSKQTATKPDPILLMVSSFKLKLENSCHSVWLIGSG
jgi:hypothetical protein